MGYEYYVYERRTDGERSFIGSVEAESLEDAKAKALEQYGAPVIVDQ